MSRAPRGFTIATADWGRDRETIRAIRYEVFVLGQAVPEEEEWDGLDELHTTTHLVARAGDGAPVGTARLLAGGKLGRMAVREPFRGQGVGSALVETLVELARDRGETRLVLGAQLQAIPFYERHGFVAEGGIFLDAGIEHRLMTRCL